VSPGNGVLGGDRCAARGKEGGSGGFAEFFPHLF